MTETRKTPEQHNTTDSWTRVKGIYRKSGKLVRLQLKHHELRGLKKSFGVEYMNHLEVGASDEELQACVDKTRAQMDHVKLAMDQLRRAVQRIDEETRRHKDTEDATTPLVEPTSKTPSAPSEFLEPSPESPNVTQQGKVTFVEIEGQWVEIKD